MPEFSTGHPNGSLHTDATNADASQAWEGQLCLAIKDGNLCFLFEKKGTQFHGHGFDMLAVLTQHCWPDTVSNAFASLLSHFNDVQPALFGGVVRGCSKELRSRVRTPRLAGFVQLLASQLVFCTQSTHVFPLCLPAPSG